MATPTREELHLALIWAFDRLSTYSGLDRAEQRQTAREIGKVLLGQPPHATRYKPNYDDDSQKLLRDT
ncbi:hypothetical protein [Bradyrhizobium prioriisuperbiae]|uniref:hypothetical protein n=1 Tax=Bradyrhizobium prioriisuperbiae TaxID=2854389 RepID=UPI0028EF0D41|nr:hypothetical protein [Bradyrhizobium prioritasuperba]